jgi:2-keto-4-pentenoate hydratase/2-oxohepta-3-ene-1,7-dioic acid hydratase in catechol pathway
MPQAGVNAPGISAVWQRLEPSLYLFSIDPLCEDQALALAQSGIETVRRRIPDPTRLHLMTRLNGREVQHTGIDDLIFDIPTLISYCSDWTPLVAGDVISTGTPEGVGFARKPPLWMKPGDVVEVEIDGGVGVLRNPIIAEA